MRTYIGPFVVCKFNLIDTKEQRLSCPKSDCVKFGATIWQKSRKFCDQCGSEIGMMDFSIKSPSVSIEEIFAEIGDALSCVLDDDLYSYLNKEKVHVWMPNRDFGEKLNFLFGGKYNMDCFIQDIDPEVLPRQIKAFQDQFTKELAVLESKYGKDNIIYKWGVINEN